MSNCLNLNKAGEYAIAALARLALLSPSEPLPISFLARRQQIPETFLAKILTQCAKAGLVRSRKGSAGGVTLARAADEITLLEIVEAFEGGFVRETCVFYGERHCDGPRCEIYCPLRRKEEGVREGLAGITLAEMAASLRRHPDASPPLNMEETDGNRDRH